MDIKNIGPNIKRLRIQKRQTQTTIARALHVTPQAVSRWETGACYPDLESLINLAVYFDVRVDDLFRK